MAQTFDDFWSELCGYIPKLSAELAPTLVNRAWRDIRSARRWTFLIQESFIVAPDAISAGTVSVTQNTPAGQNAVVADAAASAAWTPQLLGQPPFTQRQFSLGPGNPIYNITGVDNTNPNALALQLDQTYAEPSGVNQTYQVYRCYFAMPDADFFKLVSVWDPVNGFTLWPKRPYWSRALLNQFDPQRSNQGQPVRMVPYKVDPTLGALFEMWPAQTSFTVYPCLYERRGVDLASGDSLPQAIPETMLMNRAKVKGCEWAIMNAGQHPELRGVDWRLIMSTLNAEYFGDPGRRQPGLLTDAKRNDEETFMQLFVIPRNRLFPSFPVDGRYLQSHSPNWT